MQTMQTDFYVAQFPTPEEVMSRSVRLSLVDNDVDRSDRTWRRLELSSDILILPNTMSVVSFNRAFMFLEMASYVGCRSFDLLDASRRRKFAIVNVSVTRLAERRGVPSVGSGHSPKSQPSSAQLLGNFQRKSRKLRKIIENGCASSSSSAVRLVNSKKVNAKPSTEPDAGWYASCLHFADGPRRWHDGRCWSLKLAFGSAESVIAVAYLPSAHHSSRRFPFFVLVARVLCYLRLATCSSELRVQFSSVPSSQFRPVESLAVQWCECRVSRLVRKIVVQCSIHFPAYRVVLISRKFRDPASALVGLLEALARFAPTSSNEIHPSEFGASVVDRPPAKVIAEDELPLPEEASCRDICGISISNIACSRMLYAKSFSSSSAFNEPFGELHDGLGGRRCAE
ncbi:hypothetical protein V9T40_013116 [Parthenolecanium corni]|uniref:Uncharacterized protein n=1 Tax=Parthenolecanium corni TaxID=536013 RepID=A0AAN9Y5E3_9HEMI